jgi:hypothetical protein
MVCILLISPLPQFLIFPSRIVVLPLSYPLLQKEFRQRKETFSYQVLVILIPYFPSQSWLEGHFLSNDFSESTLISYTNLSLCLHLPLQVSPTCFEYVFLYTWTCLSLTTHRMMWNVINVDYYALPKFIPTYIFCLLSHHFSHDPAIPHTFYSVNFYSITPAFTVPSWRGFTLPLPSQS